jgi:hypothetical protein
MKSTMVIRLLAISAALLGLSTIGMQSAIAGADGNACWGQATAVFAQLGEMGEHASSQGQPRVGLANLARTLYQMGAIEAPTLAALGAFVTAELGLSVDACKQDQAAVLAAEAQAAANASCWGQASAVFARAGEMGRHASSFETPRLGLANLARHLYDMGVLDEPTLAALGAFVTAELGLTVDACL